MRIRSSRFVKIFSLMSVVSLIFCLAKGHALMERLSIEQLTRNAESVVAGRIESMTSKWKGDIIVTEISMKVTDTIAGAATGEEIIVEYPGGVVGDVGLRVSDVNMPSEGDQVLLFLETTDENYITVGRAQGQYFVDAHRDIAHRSGFEVHSDRMLASDEDSLSYQDLLTRVREVAIEK